MSGSIDTSKLNTPPEQHEMDTALFLAEQGKNIVFLQPSNIRETHTPDIVMDGLEWEIKCPQGKSKHTIENNIKAAVLQSCNIIIDLRRVGIPEDKCMAQIQKQFDVRKSIKRVLVITKGKELITLFRNY